MKMCEYILNAQILGFGAKYYEIACYTQEYAIPLNKPNIDYQSIIDYNELSFPGTSFLIKNVNEEFKNKVINNIKNNIFSPVSTALRFKINIAMLNTFMFIDLYGTFSKKYSVLIEWK